MKKRLVVVLALVLAFTSVFFAGCGKDDTIYVGSGGTTGTYYGFCNVVATVINEKTDMNLSVQSSGASKANILGIADGEVDMAIVQNDVMDYAYSGTSLFESDGKIQSFSTLGAVYAEVCQVVARADSGIKTIADLKGKKVSVGDGGSGVEFNAQQILGAYDITFEDIEKSNLSFNDSANALKDGTIDAFFCTAGAPTVAITDLSTTTGIVLLGVDDEHLSKLQADYAFYTAYKIPAETYKGVAEVTTVAVKATFIVSNDLSEDTVYNLTKAIYENAGEYSHDKAKEMNLEYAVTGITVPFHPGADKYFKEVGAIK